MKIEILPEAKADLDDGYWFYDGQNPGLGEYFLSSVTSDIRSLQLFGGIHPRYLGKFRMLASRFPYSVFYEVIWLECSPCLITDAILNGFSGD